MNAASFTFVMSGLREAGHRRARPPICDGRHARRISGSAFVFGQTRMNWVERRAHPPDRSGTGQTARSAALKWLGLLRSLRLLGLMELRT